jgi:hypothetical protein
MSSREVKHDPNMNKGFCVGDRIRQKKSGFEGIIDRLEWNGGERSALVSSGKKNGSLYILPLTDLEVVKAAKEMEPEEVKPEIGESNEDREAS